MSADRVNMGRAGCISGKKVPVWTFVISRRSVLDARSKIIAQLIFSVTSLVIVALTSVFPYVFT